MLQGNKWTAIVNAGLLVSMIAIGAASTRGAPPAAPRTPAKVVAFEVNDSSLTPIESKWADYFGTHYAKTTAESSVGLVDWRMPPVLRADRALRSQSGRPGCLNRGIRASRW